MRKKQRVFIEEYLKCWNATEAARVAGYAHPRQQGSRALSNVDIQAAIQKRISEKVMSADEVLLRLAEQARNEGSAYLLPDGSVDLAAIIRDGKSHLVKGIKYSRQGDVIVEFHDAQAALKLIGTKHKLFTEKQDIDLTLHVDGLADLLDRIYGNSSS